MSLLALASERSSNLNSLINFLIAESDADLFCSLFVPPIISKDLAVKDKIEITANTLKEHRPALSDLCRASGQSKEKLICTSKAIGFIQTINLMIKTYGIDANKTYLKYDNQTSTFYVLNLDGKVLYSIQDQERPGIK